MKTILNLMLIFGLALAARAQDEVPPPMPAAPTYSDAQLDQLLGPIALYPDPLISELLPAATFPTEIVMADRYINNGGDPNAIDQQGWDPSIQALAHYPSVLQWMDDNLNWTTQVGQAFENQQQDVMGSIQRLRTDAYNLGNLQSTPQQQVVDDNGYIEIIPVNPDDLYVPDYQPDQVYYDEPSGPPYITFGIGYIIGPWLLCDFDWRNHHLIVWDHDHPRPDNWWHQRPAERDEYLARQTTTWHPANSAGYQGGDRGWNNQPVRAGNNANYHVQNFQNNRNLTPPAVNRPAPEPTEHFQSYDQRAPDAFSGGQNASQARDFSERGQQSMESAGRSAPAPSAPSGFHGGSAGFGGGGGGRR